MQLLQVWSAELTSGDAFQARLLWATACIAFFGFCRLGELLQTSTSVSAPLMLSDLSIDSHSAPSQIRVLIKRAKNDPFGHGAAVILGATGKDLCPVIAILNYLAVRPPGPGPLLIWQDSLPLLRDQFVWRVKESLRSAGLNHSLYSGHSFRIGAATSAAAAGVPTHLIQTMGRWSSDAYRTYIRSPPDVLASVLHSLASQHQSC